MSIGSGNHLASVKAAIDSLRMQVNPANVLHVHHAVQAEALLLTQELRQNGFPVRIGIAADESVSRIAAQGFNTKIQNLVRHARLWALADQLTARGIPRPDATALVRMNTGINFAGQLGAITWRGGRQHRGPWVIGFIRNHTGGAFLQLRRAGTPPVARETPGSAPRSRHKSGTNHAENDRESMGLVEHGLCRSGSISRVTPLVTFAHVAVFHAEP